MGARATIRGDVTDFPLRDGNDSDRPTNWLYPTEGFEEVSAEALDDLMRFTLEGNLGWVIFPPEGYRL